jgi:hypothetical protein
MLGEQTIKTKEYWSQQFGLYPMLMQPKISKNKFLMLNGGNKDFCLQTDYSGNENDTFSSESWSTNTKYFLVIKNNIIYLYNWLYNKPEKYTLKYIEENLNKFYSYLSSKSYKTPDDAVPYIIGIFRQLRNMTREREPDKALNLLFKLLISIDEKDDYKKIDISK